MATNRNSMSSLFFRLNPIIAISSLVTQARKAIKVKGKIHPKLDSHEGLKKDSKQTRGIIYGSSCSIKK